MGRIVLVGGGARSGKSRFALRRATDLGSRTLFIATAVAFDDEMRERIARHRAERDGRFETVEESKNIADVIRRATQDVVLVDCLTLWLSNLLIDGGTQNEIEERVEGLIATLREASPHIVLVTNEVGLGIVPEHALGRLFRDVAGRAHQRLAVVADEVYFGAMGCMLRLKPGPVEATTVDALEVAT